MVGFTVEPDKTVRLDTVFTYVSVELEVHISVYFRHSFHDLSLIEHDIDRKIDVTADAI